MHTMLATGDRLEQNRNAAILHFSGQRKVLSTGALGGGLRNDITAVFNYNDCPQAGAYCVMHGDTMEEHQAWTAQSLGLDPQTTTGLNTGANIDNSTIQVMTYEDFSVTAIVTAGLEINACRVGDHVDLHERDGLVNVLGGTVNIILVVDADLSDRCITRALVTCTEAKVAALQELMVAGRIRGGLATGSGTDGTVIVSNSESPVKLNESGEQFKLGEYIGKAVNKAVKEALFQQTGLGPGMQHSVFRRLERFGVTETAIWEAYRRACPAPMPQAEFTQLVQMMSLDGATVVLSSLYAHLIDQVQWGLIRPREAVWAADQLLTAINTHYAMDFPFTLPENNQLDGFAHAMADAFIRVVVQWMIASHTERQ